MPSDSETPDYPYTGRDNPDRTGATLVLEASSLALEPLATRLEQELDLILHPDHASTEELPLSYTLNIGFDTAVERTVYPPDLPIHSQFKTHVLETDHRDDGQIIH